MIKEEDIRQYFIFLREEKDLTILSRKTEDRINSLFLPTVSYRPYYAQKGLAKRLSCSNPTNPNSQIRLDFEAARRVNQHRLGILPGAAESELQPAQHLSIPSILRSLFTNRSLAFETLPTLTEIADMDEAAAAAHRPDQEDAVSAHRSSSTAEQEEGEEPFSDAPSPVRAVLNRPWPSPVLIPSPSGKVRTLVATSDTIGPPITPKKLFFAEIEDCGKPDGKIHVVRCCVSLESVCEGKLA
jgi:hypothetical protein